jgi:hypothetical protein
MYPILYGNPYPSILVTDVTPFDRLYPHKTLNEFIVTSEAGFFVICAKVVGLFRVKSGWYPACRCGSFLDISVGSYFCPQCCVHVFSVSPK